MGSSQKLVVVWFGIEVKKCANDSIGDQWGFIIEFSVSKEIKPIIIRFKVPKIQNLGHLCYKHTTHVR